MQQFRLPKFKALMLLVALFIANLLWSPQTVLAQNNTKEADIKQLFDLMYGNQLVETIIVAMTEAMQLDAGPMKSEVIDSMRVLLLENAPVLRDSVAAIYDRMYTAQEIKEMLKFYQTPIGKRMIETQGELFQQSMAFGRSWAQSQSEEIKIRLKPVIEKHRKNEAQANEEDGKIEKDELSFEVNNHTNNKRKLQGSKPFKYAIQYNEKSWKPIPAKEINDLGDLALVNIQHDMYALVIAEKEILTLEDLRKAALINMHKVASEVKVRKSVMRKVNGKDVLLLVMDCKIDEHQLTYHNYYYSSDWGILQYIVFGDKPTMAKQQTQVEALLSGLMVE